MALSGAAIVGQSGGPTVVINSSLVGYITAAKAAGNITHVYGMRHGIEGLLKEDIIDLGAESDETLEKIKNVPAAALGSVRMKPTKETFEAMVPVLKKYNIKFFFYIGGNDSAETAHLTNTYAKEAGSLPAPRPPPPPHPTQPNSCAPPPTTHPERHVRATIAANINAAHVKLFSAEYVFRLVALFFFEKKKKTQPQPNV
eukprot:SAG31_NODE_1078_length_10032_cov_4.602034_1_plen_200_part_00